MNIKRKITLNSPKSNSQIIERGELDTPDIKIYDRSFSWFGISIKSGALEILLWTPNLVHDIK